ncbi:MAG: hypothetical protein HFJ73_01575 [Eggerthellaceae bacterium]|nr:hypothetical protein [Eggerthellaceae bacterium]
MKMAKDFDDFESELLDGRYTSDDKDVYYKVSEEFDDVGDEYAKAFAQMYIQELTLSRLRAYHDWANS